MLRHYRCIYIWRSECIDPFRHSYETKQPTNNGASVASRMPEVLFQPSAIVLLCYIWQVKLRMPLARHKAMAERSTMSTTAWCFHGNSPSSFPRTWLLNGWLGEKEDVFTIFRSNNCLISSHNTRLTPFDGLMVSGLVLQHKWKQGHYVSLFKAPISEP